LIRKNRGFEYARLCENTLGALRQAQGERVVVDLRIFSSVRGEPSRTMNGVFTQYFMYLWHNTADEKLVALHHGKRRLHVFS
jgi:hypothetical protein